MSNAAKPEGRTTTATVTPEHETAAAAFARGYHFGLTTALGVISTDEMLGANHTALKMALQALLPKEAIDGG